MSEEKKISLDEYCNLAKEEIDAFKKKWESEATDNPDGWPMEMGEGDWSDQELAERFGQLFY